MDTLKLRSAISSSLLQALIIATLHGCGGGGGGGASGASGASPATLLSASGRGVDGYILGGTATLDVNDDHLFGGSDPTTLTDASGTYSFSGQGEHLVSVTGGVDISSNTPFLGQLLAAPGSSVASPLTTIVMLNVLSNLPSPVAGVSSPISAAAVSQAESALKLSLGIPSTVALMTTDPVAAVNSPTASQLIQLSAATCEMMDRVAIAVAAATGISSPTPVELLAIYKQAAMALGSLTTTATTPIDLTTAAGSALVNSVIAKTVVLAAGSAEVKAALPAANAAALANLAPASVAAVATQTIAAEVAAVASAPASTLAASGTTNPAVAASNPALSAFQDTSLQLALSSMAGLLGQNVAAVNSPSALQSLANTVITSLAGNTAAGAASAAAAINAQLTLTLAAVPSASSALASVDPTTLRTTQTTANAAVFGQISSAVKMAAAAISPTTSSSGAVPVYLSGLGGSQASPTTFDAAQAGGAFNFYASIGNASIARVTNCTANDRITITGGGSNHLVVANNGADVVMTANANGTVTQITLVGVASAAAIIGSLSDFNALGVCVTTYN